VVSSQYFIFGSSSSGSLLTEALTDGTQIDLQPTISPDGSTVAFLQETNGPGYIYWMKNVPGYATTELIAPSNQAEAESPAWSPFPAAKTFVGPTGVFGASSSGFLWGQLGEAFASLVSFTATTPSTVSITAQTPSGYSAPVFSVSADNLVSLSYANGFYSLPVKFVQTRTAIKPGRAGSGLSFDGSFTAVYDGKGKNLAPNGATHLVLDSKHGTATLID
jgi:hypothetical protein